MVVAIDTIPMYTVYEALVPKKYWHVIFVNDILLTHNFYVTLLYS